MCAPRDPTRRPDKAVAKTLCIHILQVQLKRRRAELKLARLMTSGAYISCSRWGPRPNLRLEIVIINTNLDDLHTASARDSPVDLIGHCSPAHLKVGWAGPGATRDSRRPIRPPAHHHAPHAGRECRPPQSRRLGRPIGCCCSAPLHRRPANAAPRPWTPAWPGS